jgi:hypothetical protein
MKKFGFSLFALALVATPAFAGLNYVNPTGVITSFGSAVAVAGATPTTITSMTLMPGTWSLSANWSSGTTAANTWSYGCIATAINSTTGCVLGDTEVFTAYDGVGGAGGGNVTGIIETVSVNTTFYWNVTTRAAAITASGRMTATRLY